MKSSPLPVWGEAGRGAENRHIPDPAGQFASSYVGMGNNPVIAVDPDGRWADRIRGIQSTGFELYRYAQWLNQHNYDYINGMFLQRTFPIEYQDPFRDGMDKRREAELEQAILLEKLGIDVEIVGGSIIIDYYYHLDGPEGKIQSRSFTLSTALQSFGYWLDNEATTDQYNAFYELFQSVSSEGVYYLERSYSYDKSYIQFLPAEGIGLLGGWSNVRGNAKIYRGSDKKIYANVSASGYAPASMKGDVTFSGSVDILVDNKIISSHTLQLYAGSSLIPSGRQDVGSTVFELPNANTDVYLRFNVGYSYSEGSGQVMPWPAQGHYIIQVGFKIDAWTY